MKFCDDHLLSYVGMKPPEKKEGCFKKKDKTVIDSVYKRPNDGDNSDDDDESDDDYDGLLALKTTTSK
eukprot:5533831-Ditylum_brightwellii.AAC.1